MTKKCYLSNISSITLFKFYSSMASFKTENELILKDLKREDLHSILTCQASNNNISVPVSTSVKLDMNCKYSLVLVFSHSKRKLLFPQSRNRTGKVTNK